MFFVEKLIFSRCNRSWCFDERFFNERKNLSLILLECFFYCSLASGVFLKSNIVFPALTLLDDSADATCFEVQILLIREYCKNVKVSFKHLLWKMIPQHEDSFPIHKCCFILFHSLSSLLQFQMTQLMDLI